jgi:host factor-I protein
VSEKEQQNIQEEFLAGLHESGATVSVFLVNGIRLTGEIVAFDQYVILLKGAGGIQIIYKHAISTVLPQEAKAPTVEVKVRPASSSTLTLSRTKPPGPGR